MQFYDQDEKSPDKFRRQYENGQLSMELNIVNGELEGEGKYWHENGQLWTRKFYKNGRLEGNYDSWYSSGQIHSQEFYGNGTPHGERKMWHENGRLHVREFYEYGLRHGIRKCWRENGMLVEKELYLNGVLKGAWKFWNAADGRQFCSLFCSFHNGKGKFFPVPTHRDSASYMKRLYSRTTLLAINSYLISDLSQMVRGCRSVSC